MTTLASSVIRVACPKCKYDARGESAEYENDTGDGACPTCAGKVLLWWVLLVDDERNADIEIRLTVKVDAHTAGTVGPIHLNADQVEAFGYDSTLRDM